LGKKQDNIFVEKIGKLPVVTIFKEQDRYKLLKQQIEIIRKEDLKGSICVALHDQKINDCSRILTENNINNFIGKKDSWIFSDKVAVSNCFQIKGLEFDHVILFDTERLFEQNDFGNPENIIFTAVTRAKNRVFVNCLGATPE